MNASATLDKITSLAKRRGFVYPSSEIYGGLANTWDFGHYGTLLKQNIRQRWWEKFVLNREDMVGIEASIFLNPKIWEASGHVAEFTDPLVDCKKCKVRTRADHLIEDKVKNLKVEGLTPEKLTDLIKEHKLACPICGSEDFTDVRKFNLLFETKMGIVEGGKSLLYLRGELAQGIFVNFKNVLNTMRVRLPFGIAQTGKAFRNEITLGQFVHRSLEFDLMEFEYFIEKSEWERVFEMWRGEMSAFAEELGISRENMRWREHEEHERSHYSQKTMDMEYHYPFGWKELFGIAYRTDFDLMNHSKQTGKDLSYRDPQSGNAFIPHVVEPTFGLSRLLGALLFESYSEEEVKGKRRVYLVLDPKVAPVKAAVFPLQKDDKLKAEARRVFEDIRSDFVCEFDDAGNIGKMYRRQDEIGTPLCVTIDYDTLRNSSTTVRDRDTMKQERVAISKLKEYIKDKINS